MLQCRCAVAIVALLIGASPSLGQTEAGPNLGPRQLPSVSQGNTNQPAYITLQQWQSTLDRLEQAEAELQSVRSGGAISTTIAPPPPPGLSRPGVTGPSDQTAIEALPGEHFDATLPSEDAPMAVPTATPASTLPTVKLSGFFHLDGAFYSQDDESIATLGDIQNGIGFRRARLQALGGVFEFTNYSLEMDFATPGHPSFQDVWLEQTHLPIVGNLRIGHFRQPISTDSLTSIRQLMFLERSLPFQAFDIFRRVGVMAYDSSDDGMTTWQNSFYRTGGFNNAPIGDSRFGVDVGDNGGFSYATRATHLLWYDEPSEGRYLLGIGGNFNYSRNTENDYRGDTPFYQARVIPEVFVGDPLAGGNVADGTPFVADTGRIASEDFQIYGVTLLGQYGRFNWQAEYMVTTVSQIGGPSLFCDGAYAQAGYFLTGENRTFNRTFGTFDKVIPYENFFSLGDRGVCGWGAWEVAGRCSYVDLSDPDAAPLGGFGSNPGSVVDTTLGLNWYWNAHTKLQFNWIHSMLDNDVTGDSDLDIFAARAQLEF